MTQQNWREKIIGHLQFAKHWLQRAEADFSRDDALRGELNLALVEAEVRHAWELSAGKCQGVKQPRTKDKRFWAAALAAGVLLMAAFWQLWPSEPSSEPSRLAKTAAQPPAARAQAEPELPLAKRSTPSPRRQQKVQKVTPSAVVAEPQREEPAVKAASLAKEETAPAPEKEEPAPVRAAPVKAVPEPEPQPTETKEVAPAIEYDLRELAQLAQEVLYANADS